MIGRVLGQRYQITENIDTGGMAYIYQAVCKKTGKTVAVKILKEELSHNADYVKRFKKEAETAFSLSHVNVVRVMDIGCDDGIYYMVMEYIDGDTLKALIDKKKRLPEREAVEYVLQVCSALSAAHIKGIIHRDIKPRNILMDHDGRVKITDFGIAQSVASIEQESSEAIGSVHYISPEQAKGERVDARTDIYSLGIMLYEMLTGTLPYTGDRTIAVALKHINEPLTPPIALCGDISMSVNNIILKATSKNKRDRYKSMAAMKSDLIRALIDPSGSFVDVPKRPEPMQKPQINTRKNLIWKVCILVVMAAVFAVAVIFGADVIASTTQQTSVAPNTVGLSSDAAVDTLESKGFDVSILYQPSETIPEGFVVSQTPEASTSIALGSSVLLNVSSGPDDLLMPDVAGITLEEATVVIEEMGLVMDKITYKPTEDGDIGIVLSQSPLPGDIVEPGDVITLVISSEAVQENAVIPQVTDMMLDKAVGRLSESGFSSFFVYFDKESELPEGMVTSQKPEEGMQVLPDSDIDLWVSDYQSKPYTCHFEESIEITEKESKVKVVLEDTINGNIVNYIIFETSEDVGKYDIKRDIDFMASGEKNVKIYINNIETPYVFEVNFFAQQQAN